ncbi:hypothetical protein HK100_011463 [Physocladia obscura]|uniref:SnoaL-like domain-containing protein n=1 Tax=Physocladia obscura TaxID=109957 RepID=A0AAD5T9H4_9FUNG|nr:hypothetical protein HK100_011463 [Physocladia obscura]
MGNTPTKSIKQNIESTNESRINAVKAFVAAYNNADIAAITALKSPDCIHAIHPLSLNRPVRNNTEYTEFYNSTVARFFSKFNVEILDLVVGNDAVAMHARSTGVSVIGDYENEYSFFFKFDKDGRICHVKEFVDSKVSDAFFTDRLKQFIVVQEQQKKLERQ